MQLLFIAGKAHHVLFGSTYYGQMPRIGAHFYHFDLTPKVDGTRLIRIQMFLSSGHNTKPMYLLQPLMSIIYIYEMLWALQVETFSMKLVCPETLLREAFSVQMREGSVTVAWGPAF